MANRIVRDFTPFKEGSEYMLKLISQLHTSRVSGFGFTAEADILGVSHYKITEQLDNKICEVCRVMHGRAFPVPDARALYDNILYEEDPEVIKATQPWPSQKKENVAAMKAMSAEDLIRAAWHVPPYHPWCRGLLVAVDAEEVILQDKKQEALAEIKASGKDTFLAQPVTLEDFKVFEDLDNVTVDFKTGFGEPDYDKILAGWNQTMNNLDPKSLYNMLDDSFGGNLSTNRGRITIDGALNPAGALSMASFETAIYGPDDKLLMQADRSFIRSMDGTLTAHHDFLKIQPNYQNQGFGTDFLAESLELYEALGVDSVELYANIDVGSYAWAKYGFLPVPASVRGLIEDVSSNLKELMRTQAVTKSEAKGIQTLINSMQDDPTAIRTLANLGQKVGGETLGYKLLGKTGWLGRLNLSDMESMDYFNGYVAGKQ